jgi:peptidoglycan hydrolase CwlO-like protein
MEALVMLCAPLITIIAWVLRERQHRAHQRQWVFDREEGEKKNNEKNKLIQDLLEFAGRQIKKLRSELSRRTQEVGELNRKIEIATDRTTKLQATLAKKDQEIDDLKKAIQISEYADKRFLLEQVYKRAFAEGRASVMEIFVKQSQAVSFLPGLEEEKRIF